MAHNQTIHAEALAGGDFADEPLFEESAIAVGLIHFADGSHGVRLDLMDRGLSFVIDTPAWLDLVTVLPEVSADEPTLSVGYVIVERHEDGEIGYRLTIQGGDVVGRLSVILLESELATLKSATAASSEAVEAADDLDHQGISLGDGIV